VSASTWLACVTIDSLFRDKYFDAIFVEVFRSILHEHSEHLAEIGADGDDLEDSTTGGVEDNSRRMKFDYSRIATLLFEAGSQASVNSKRRKRLYGLSKK
jgi:hypothetical protein